MSKKRSQGEGSIFQRKDGLWAAQMTIQGKHVAKYFHSQSECREWLKVTRAQVENGLTLSGAQTTLAHFLSEWLVATGNSIRPKTFVQYQQIVRQHIVPTLGNIKLKDLRPDHIQALYNQKAKDGMSNRTLLLVHAVLHRAFNQALKWGIVVRNPVQAVNRPKFKHKEMKTLTDSQVRTFLSFATNSRFEVLYWLAVTTGLRRGELLGLKWSDLDWANHRIRVQRQLQRLPSGLEFSEPKSSAGKRVIAVGDSTIAKLRKHVEFQSRERQEAGKSWHENDLIFPSPIGTPMDPDNLCHEFKRLLVAAGLPDIRFHDLRHTAASLMLQQGVHPKVVQERLGHSDISLTLNTYSHILPVMQDEVAHKMDELLTPIDVSEQLKKVQELQAIYPQSPINQRRQK